MFTLSIPGYKETFHIEHLILDFNGTLAVNGKLINGVTERLILIHEQLKIHVVTDNSFSTAAQELKDVICRVVLLQGEIQGIEKDHYLKRLDPAKVISIGNGCNDRFLLKNSAIGIAVMQEEGISVQTMNAADIVFKDILSALDIINNPTRIIATLRS